MKAALRGTEIYFDIAGMQLAPYKQGFIERPILFMLHGGPGADHTRFKQHSLELQDVAQLVFIDHRGCGRSKKTNPADYTLENNIEDIEALRNYLGLENICLLGTSYGGMVAQGYAIRYPKRVKKMILAATAPSFRVLNEAKQILQKYANPQQLRISEHLWNGTFKNHRHVMQFFEMAASFYSTSSKQDQKKFGLPQTAWSHEALNKGFSDSLRHFDFIPDLKKIICPTLILAGKQDWICPVSQSKIIAQYILHAKLKIFNHCGHSIAVDAHDKYIKAIKNFLR